MMTTQTLPEMKHAYGKLRAADVGAKEPVEIEHWLARLDEKPCPGCYPKFEAKSEIGPGGRPDVLTIVLGEPARDELENPF